MSYFIRFVYPFILYAGAPFLLLLAFWRWKFYKKIVYNYSLASTLQQQFKSSSWKSNFLFFSRFFLLSSLLLFIAKPQLVDSRSTVTVDGNDIMLVLDVSGSMQWKDFDNKQRLEVAKQEAIRFIKKRDNDPIGLVIFGKDAVSRCPITLDKNIITRIVENLYIGIVDPDGTLLSTGILTAANRLKNSNSKNKMMIVLTDGVPSEGDVRPEVALEVARRMGIKIYTVGIGSDEIEYIRHPLYGLIQKPNIDKKLLQTISESTGGKFFLAKNSDDMREIYNTIDKLETTKVETNIFHNYYDIFVPFIMFILLLFVLELFVSTFIWFAL